MFSIFFNGLLNTSFGQNVSIVSSTKVVNRYVVGIGAGFLFSTTVSATPIIFDNCHIFLANYMIISKQDNKPLFKEIDKMDKYIKNIEFSKPQSLVSLVSYQPGQVVSRTLSQGKALSLTLFAFDKDEEISSHASKGDAMVHILDGKAKITIGQDKFDAKKGDVIVMPANVPHALFATTQFKMMLTVVFKLD